MLNFQCRALLLQHLCISAVAEVRDTKFGMVIFLYLKEMRFL